MRKVEEQENKEKEKNEHKQKKLTTEQKGR